MILAAAQKADEEDVVGYRAGEIMNTEVVLVKEDMDVKELARLFLRRQISGAPVVDERNELVGVISQTDLVYHSLTRGEALADDSHFYESARMEGRRVPTGFQIEDMNSVPVSEIMTPVVHSVSERAGLQTIINLMTRKHIHRVVVTRGRKVVGIISALDVLAAVRKNLSTVAT
jgi:CBS domain-containing protein